MTMRMLATTAPARRNIFAAFVTLPRPLCEQRGPKLPQVCRIDRPRWCELRFPVTQQSAFHREVPFIKELGVEFISAEAGRAVVALTLEPRHLNSWAVAHG